MGRIIDYLNDKQHLNKVLRISAICCAAALVMLLSVMIWTGTNSGKKAEFVPPAFDQLAVDGEPTVPDDAGYTPLRVEQGYMFYVCGSIKYTNGGADVYLTSPKDNRVWLMMRAYDEKGKVIGETGLIRPGQYLKSISLNKEYKQDANIKLKVIAYQPDTYYSMGNVDLNMKLKVA